MNLQSQLILKSYICVLFPIVVPMKKIITLKYLLLTGFICGVSVFLPSCKTMSINSEPPDKSLATVPRIPQVLSVINVPVSIPVIQLQNRINQELSGIIYKDDQFKNNIK